VFQDSNIVIILWFLAVYFIVYLLLNIFQGNIDSKNSVSRWVDIVSLGLIFVYVVLTYFTKSESEKKDTVKNLYADLKYYMNDPLSLVSIGFFILTLYIFIYILSIPMDENKPIIITIVENFAWLFFVIVLISTFLKSTTNFSLTDFMDDITSALKQEDTVVVAVDKKQTGNGNVSAKSASSTFINNNEVFNVGNNMYTYDDAQTVCASMGARLATYDEMEDAYNNGAEWCNYGWSDGQTAYFPTQKATWNKLQKSSSMKNSCGRPGINGGYMNNPETRLGVNCYGKKPKPKKSDLESIGTGDIIPKTPEDAIMDAKIKFWKENSEKLFKINSYNNAKWSAY
jgi:hypothetical protein